MQRHVTSALALVVALIIPLFVLFATASCGRKSHARSTSYMPPPLPAGFVEHSGAGWRIAVPSTWKDVLQKGPAAFAVADPQSVDDFHAYANVVTEPYRGESDTYAKANEAGLHNETRASIELSHEDVIDGDSTLIFESRWTPAPPSTVAYRTMQAALASRGTGYVVTCAVSSSAFERYRSTCESIVRSFAVER
jgi:hypothetical protein